jgi:UPF0755 protein
MTPHLTLRPPLPRPLGRGRHPLGRRWLALALIGLVILAVPLSYLKYRADLAPVQTGGEPAYVEFTVGPGWNAQLIATHLKANSLIRNRNAFITYVNLHGLRPRLKAGTYNLSQAQPANEIAEAIAGGRTLSKRLVVPEGYRLEQIESAAVKAGIPADAFQAALSAPHRQSFLTSKPAGVSLEGYLFPDSYEITSKTTAATLVDAMLDNFSERVGPEYTAAFAAQGLTLHQGLTIASIVEREVNISADRPIVAQIFLKRYKLGMALGSDVTTHYASDLLGVPFNLDINSPYNTRKFAGLPPGPICSPGLGALDAVAHPAATDYLFFLTGKDGKTYFAKTLAEHNQNIARYLN